MKKALLVLLFLAVAGGLFAQLTWSGLLYNDFRATLESGYTNWGLNFGEMTGRLQATYRNEAGTFGGRVRLQASVNSASLNQLFNVYYGWFTMYEGSLKILGGKWTDGEFYEGAYWVDEYLWSSASYGIQAIYYPLDGLSVGFGLHSAALATFNDLRYWAGVAYSADNFGVYAQGDFQKDNINAAVNGYYEAGPVLAALSVALNRLDKFDPNGSITVREAVDFTGVENLDVSLDSTQTFYGDSEKKAEVDISLGGSYVLDIAGINLVGLALGLDITGESFSFQPYVRFGQGGSRYLRLDYIGDIGFDGSYDNTIRLRFYWSF
jgi:hypothetical protein